MAGVVVLAVLWGLAGMMLGIAAYCLLPWLVVQPLPRRWRQPVVDWYIGQATSSGRRLNILDREHAGVDVKRTKWSSKKRAEKFSIDGEEQECRDVGGMMRRLGGRPFAILSETYDAIVDPLHLHLAERYRKATHHDRDLWTVTVDGPDDPDNPDEWPTEETLMQPIFGLRERVKLVDTDAINHLQPGDADPTFIRHGYENGKKSQRGYSNNIRLRDMLYLIGAFVVCAAMGWFVSSYGGQVADSAGDSVGLWIHALGVVL